MAKSCGAGKKLVTIRGKKSFCASRSRGPKKGVSPAKRAAGKRAHKKACATMRAKGWTGGRAKMKKACGGR